MATEGCSPRSAVGNTHLILSPSTYQRDTNNYHHPVVLTATRNPWSLLMATEVRPSSIVLFAAPDWLIFPLYRFFVISNDVTNVTPRTVWMGAFLCQMRYSLRDIVTSTLPNLYQRLHQVQYHWQQKLMRTCTTRLSLLKQHLTIYNHRKQVYQNCHLQQMNFTILYCWAFVWVAWFFVKL
jgi:hypothetical protein